MTCSETASRLGVHMSYHCQTNLVARVFVPLDQWSEKGNTLGATISRVRNRCRLCSEIRWAEVGCFLCNQVSKWLLLGTLVFRPLVKGNEDSWNETDLMNLSSGVDTLRLPLR